MATKTAAKQPQIPQDHKDKIEAMQDAAEQADKGVMPAGQAQGVPDVPASKKGGGERRLFEVSPGNKVWLTEAEATGRGFFWSPVGADYKKRPA